MKINLRIDAQGIISSSGHPNVLRVEHDGSLTIIFENAPEASAKLKEPSAVQNRLNDELAELQTKIEKLGAFIQEPDFETIKGQSRQLLIEQHAIMESYARILEMRIKLRIYRSMPTTYHPV